MTDQFRGLRCRPGDLAVIVQDEPECHQHRPARTRRLRELRIPRRAWLSLGNPAALIEALPLRRL